MHASVAGAEFGPITRLMLKHARDAFESPARIAAEWRELNFTAPPDYARAIAEYDAFANLLTAGGAVVDWLPAAPGAGLDSIYVRDASIVCDDGVILCRMGKPARQHEPAKRAATVTRENALVVHRTPKSQELNANRER